jgi:hypothetical protein
VFVKISRSWIILQINRKHSTIHRKQVKMHLKTVKISEYWEILQHHCKQAAKYTTNNQYNSASASVFVKNSRSWIILQIARKAAQYKEYKQ